MSCPVNIYFSYAEINVYLVSLSFFDITLLRNVISKKDSGLRPAGQEQKKGVAMFFFDLEHNVKKDSSSKNAFHYITRTAHFKHDQKHEGEVLEWVESGSLPKWAKGRPDLFWAAADRHEIERGRTSSAITIALPSGLSVQQRQALAKDLIAQFATQHQLPYTAAIHTHRSSITGEQQPHLHLMYSERSLSDGLERLPAQFFKQYRPKNPTKGGAPKLTANALGYGRDQVQAYREITETVINQHLDAYAPTKKVLIAGIEVEVSSRVSCLSHADYSKKHGLQLEAVPQLPRWMLYADDLSPEVVETIENKKKEIKEIRERNNRQVYAKEYEAALLALKQQERKAQPVEQVQEQPVAPPPVEQPKQQTLREQVQQQLDAEVEQWREQGAVHASKLLPPDSEWKLLGCRDPSGVYYTSLGLSRAKGGDDLQQALRQRSEALEDFFGDDLRIAHHDHALLRRVLVNDSLVIDRLSKTFGVTGEAVEQAQKQGAEGLAAVSETILTNRVAEVEQQQKRSREPSQAPSHDRSRDWSYEPERSRDRDMPSP